MKLSALHSDEFAPTRRCFALFEAREDVVNFLDGIAKKLQIPGMIIGGAALPKYNFERATKDVDVIMTLDDATKMGQHIENLGFQFIGHNAFKRGDMEVNFCLAGALTHQQGSQRFPPCEDKTPGLHYVSLPWLLAMKISAGRMKDRGDYTELIVRNDLNLKWIEDNVVPLLTDGRSRQWAVVFCKMAEKQKNGLPIEEEDERNIIRSMEEDITRK